VRTADSIQKWNALFQRRSDMKRAWLLAGVLFLTASVSRAAILEAWCTFVTSGDPQASDGFSHPLAAGLSTPTSSMVGGGQLYTVEVWMEIVPDPSLGETAASIAGGGLESAAASIVTNNSTFVTEPNSPDPVKAPKWVDDYFPNTGPNGLNYERIDAAREVPPGVIIWGDNDLCAMEAAGFNKGGAANLRACALNTPFLFVEENWYLDAWPTYPANLHLEIATTSDHWDSTVSGQEDLFSQIETGTVDPDGNYVAGSDLTIDPSGDIPEPATVALLGLGAAAALRRRGSVGRAI
jgi:hypothetical protein